MVCHLCAEFADKQCRAILKSPDMIRRKVYIERKTREIQERDRSMSQMRSGTAEYNIEARAQTDARNLLKLDKKTLKEQMAAHDEFLKQAIDLYSQSLSLSDAFDDDAPIKLFSLWFANFDDGVINGETLRAALSRVPSHKFIFLVVSSGSSGLNFIPNIFTTAPNYRSNHSKKQSNAEPRATSRSSHPHVPRPPFPHLV